MERGNEPTGEKSLKGKTDGQQECQIEQIWYRGRKNTREAVASRYSVMGVIDRVQEWNAEKEQENSKQETR